MNVGQNFFNWFVEIARPLLLAAIVAVGVWLGMKREFTKLIGVIVVFIIAVGLVYNPQGVQGLLLTIFNAIAGT